MHRSAVNVHIIQSENCVVICVISQFHPFERQKTLSAENFDFPRLVTAAIDRERPKPPCNIPSDSKPPSPLTSPELEPVVHDLQTTITCLPPLSLESNSQMSTSFCVNPQHITSPSPSSSTSSILTNAQRKKNQYEVVLSTQMCTRKDLNTPSPISSLCSGNQQAHSPNINTLKNHSLGDYPDQIRRYGTTDSFSTESVSASLCYNILYWKF